MATQRFYDGQPGPDIRRELNNFEAILDGTVASAQSASTAATSASVKAQQWADAATSASVKAQQWADAAPGVEVEAGKYSAKHWADRAQTTVTGSLIYRGSHSAASGAYPATPSLGDYYKISAAGTLGGVAYSAGDSIIYNGTGWDKIDSTDAVTSVAGRVGAVVLTKGDVGLGNVDNTSDANKPVSTAQSAAIAARYGKNNVLGTVSQSAGVPTGAVIERGSNANGEYVRFADGTQICTISSYFTQAAEVVWSYPASFVGTPTYLSASANYEPAPRHYSADAATTGGNVSATIYRCLRSNSAPVTDTFMVNCVAIGRWF